MDLRTKLVFSLVAVALGSMAALGTLAYGNAEDLLTTRTLRQLSSLAEAKKEDLASVVDGWQDRVSLIASRNELAVEARALRTSGPSTVAGDIGMILEDAQAASAAIHALAVFDARGRLVARVGRDREQSDPLDQLSDSAMAAGDTVTFAGVSFIHDSEPVVRFLAPLIDGGDRVGYLMAWLVTRDLLDVTGNYTGLGETGEAMIVVRDEDGTMRLLNPVRHDPGSGDARDAESELRRRALMGQEGPFSQGLTDYRGQTVWAATRFLPEVGWGLAVKFDAAEERAAILEFRGRLVGVGFSLSAFAILLGTALGFRIARPIHEVAEAANRIRLGEMDARAHVDSEDEIGLLASTMNEMADELERRMARLQEYRRFFKVSRDMLCIAGTDGFFKRINPAFERALGWPEAELLDRPFVDFVHEEDVDKTVAETERLARGIPTVNFENRFRKADGSYARLRWTCHPDPESGLLYAIARELNGGDA